MKGLHAQVGKVLGLLSAAGLASSAFAQTRYLPRAFMWSDGVPGNITPAPAHVIRPVILVYLSPSTTPAQAADAAVDQIRALVDALELDRDDVCISFNGIGRDFAR
jgi:hypothetical protein